MYCISVIYSFKESTESPEAEDDEEENLNEGNLEFTRYQSEPAIKQKTKKGFSFFGRKRSKNKKSNDNK